MAEIQAESKLNWAKRQPLKDDLFLAIKDEKMEENLGLVEEQRGC